MAEGDLNRGQAIAQSAATAAIARAYKVTTYQAGTWQRHEPRLTMRSRTAAPTEHYEVEFHVQHDPGKVRKVLVVLTEHHTGGMYPSTIAVFNGTSRKVFAGSMTIDGEFQSWQQDNDLLNNYVVLRYPPE